jgi:adenylate cyclase
MPSGHPGYQRFFAELKRRRVFRVMAVYGALGFVLLQVVDLAVPALLLPDWTYRFVALILLLGLPVAVVLTWAFEVTPEGVRRTADATQAELAEILSAPRSKRWPAGVLALGGLAVLLAGAWYVGRSSAGSPAADGASAVLTGDVSIAVLPFADMSPDGDQEYFSDGISEELLNLLAKIPDLRVASRTSAFSFKGQNLEIPDIAGRLGVDHVLEGSVRKAGDEIRITAQLIDARTDSHIWSETWDRTLEDVFAVQDEIAAEVVRELKVTLLGEAPHVEETDPEAYALFLQARELNRRSSVEAYERAVQLLEESLAIDSTYAPAWAALGVVYVNQTGFGLRPFAEGVELARAATRRAVALDSTNAAAHALLGHVAMYYDDDLAAAARHLDRALELAPSDARILGTAATLEGNLGDREGALALQEYVVLVDPVTPSARSNLALNYRNAGRWDEAIAEHRVALDLAPDNLGQHHGIALSLLGKGEPEAALTENEREPDEGWRLLGRAAAYHSLGRKAESDAALSELIEKFEQEMAYNIAGAYAWRGQPDRAFEWLAKAVEYGDPGLSEIPLDIQWLSSLHDDPRWIPFLESIGKSPEQLARIDFDVKLPE